MRLFVHEISKIFEGEPTPVKHIQ